MDDTSASGKAVNFKLNVDATIRWRTAWFAILLLGAILRLLRLSWQPIWWDEGYSIFFATEPLSTMFWLTAHDIHPPLYYTLLQGWFNLLGNTSPESARLFSSFIGIATLPIFTWAALTLWPKKRWRALLATALLALNPLHIYYSQEIRMYGLAMLLTLIASTLLWKIQQRLEQQQRPYGLLAAYIITASLALLTLYYAGFMLLAHQLWALTANRNQWRRYLWFLGAALLILLIQLPWWLYALPKLFVYIADKVIADQDTPLMLWSYLGRHWLAFFTGHLPAPQPWLESARIALASLVALLTLSATLLLRRVHQPTNNERQIERWLLALLLIPTLVGFAVNLVYPFFPEGGERLLLQTQPYLLLLITLIGAKLYTYQRILAITTWLATFAAAIIGLAIFYTTPRYIDHDYRPIIQAITQRSRANDTILALFPWQVGYWRAYSPRTASGDLLQPQPKPVDQTILHWSETFAHNLDANLEQGTIWFPMPESLGSTLPSEIENHLKSVARNLENHWFTPATRLTAWVKLDEQPEATEINANFQGQVTLVSAGITPITAASANTPIAIDLCWQPATQRADLHITLRLLDDTGHTWASRDLTPLAAYINAAAASPCQEQIAIEIPVGIPPGAYALQLGVGPEQSDQLLTPLESNSPLVTLGQIEIQPTAEQLSPYRLPIEHRQPANLIDSELTLLGYTGPDQTDEILAGDAIALTLFLQKSNTPLPPSKLYMSLLDRQGNGVAGWEDWPLPNYPLDQWPPYALTQLPISFFLPPTLEAGEYTLITGLLDPSTGNKSAPITLSSVQITRRPTTFTPPATMQELTPTLFGSHATLVGYSYVQDATQIQLELTWHIQQPLLPPHDIFVHLFDASGQRLAQSDSEPMTHNGRAPTGSWLPNEYLTTQHTITIPPGATQPFTLQTGLYLPATEARLPASQEGISIGDHITISLPTTP